MLRNLRRKLQDRRGRLNGADLNNFFVLAKQFFAFFDSEQLLRSLGQEMLAKCPGASLDVDQGERGVALYGLTELDAATIGYVVFRRYSEDSNPMGFFQFCKSPEEFRDAYLQPFFDYLDEKLDDGDFVLSTLVRFKHTCEWFRREELNQLFHSETRSGETSLAWRMYEYLYGQGIEFNIEPASASGKPDMVSAQSSDHPLIADAKVFIPESGRGVSYLAKGLHQLYRYTCDFNQSIGYLVVFSVTERRLVFSPEFRPEAMARWVHNDKTIFVIVIDIFAYSRPASHRAVPETMTITDEDLMREISHANPQE